MMFKNLGFALAVGFIFMFNVLIDLIMWPIRIVKSKLYNILFH